MPVLRMPMKVLRHWYYLSGLREVQALSHPAFRWLSGLCMNWSGVNNGVIEFTKRRHGKKYGLDRTDVFQRARDEVLDTKLVAVTRNGGPRKPTLYMLTNQPIQASPDPDPIGTEFDPLPKDSWDGIRPSLGRNSTHKNRPVLENARASDLAKNKTLTNSGKLIDSGIADSAATTLGHLSRIGTGIAPTVGTDRSRNRHRGCNA